MIDTESHNSDFKTTSQEGQPNNHTSEKNIKMKNQFELKQIDRKELRLMLIADPNISHIAKYFNVSRSTIKSKIKKYGLDEVREASEENFRKEMGLQKEKFYRSYLQLNGVRKIAKDMHTSPLKVKAALVERNYEISEAGKWTKIVDHVLTSNYDIPISWFLEQVIIGQLLGDASLRIMKKGDLSYPDLDFGEYKVQRDFLKWLVTAKIDKINDELIQKFNYARKVISDYPTAIFRFSQGIMKNWIKEQWVEFNSQLFINEGYKNTVKHSSINSNPFVYFDTIASVQIFDIYAKWYPNNIKTVPFDFEMTPDILLYWYIGDGSLSKNSFYIATHDFSKKEVDFLCNLLFNAFGLICHSSHTDDGWILTISLKKDNLKRFFDYLDQSFAPALALAKKVYPWKFDVNLTVAEAIKTGK